METLSWRLNQLATAAHGKNVEPLLSDLDVRLNLAYMAVYAMSYFAKPVAVRGKALSAAFLCIGITYSPLFDILSQVQLYAVFAIIYAKTSLQITNKKVLLSCCIMMIFQSCMALDSWRYPNVETWIYTNYESVTTCIHVLIISAFLYGGPIKNWKDSGTPCSQLWQCITWYAQ